MSETERDAVAEALAVSESVRYVEFSGQCPILWCPHLLLPPSSPLGDPPNKAVPSPLANEVICKGLRRNISVHAVHISRFVDPSLIAPLADALAGHPTVNSIEFNSIGEVPPCMRLHPSL